MFTLNISMLINEVVLRFHLYDNSRILMGIKYAQYIYIIRLLILNIHIATIQCEWLLLRGLIVYCSIFLC